MAENLIFYGSCFFISLLGLGMTWETKEKWIFAKIIFVVIAFLAVITMYLRFHSAFQFLDIRHSLSWLNDHEPSEMLVGRMKVFVLIFIWSLITSEMVCLQHLLIYWRQYVTKNKSKPAAGCS